MFNGRWQFSIPLTAFGNFETQEGIGRGAMYFIAMLFRGGVLYDVAPASGYAEVPSVGTMTLSLVSGSSLYLSPGETVKVAAKLRLNDETVLAPPQISWVTRRTEQALVVGPLTTEDWVITPSRLDVSRNPDGSFVYLAEFANVPAGEFNLSVRYYSQAGWAWDSATYKVVQLGVR
jgi:hypothetical protein